MELRDHSGDAGDPFAGDPFDTAPPPLRDAPPWNSVRLRPESDFPTAPTGEVNTLATLSVVFAFVFAPVGAVLAHLALSQIRRRHQPGRKRAVLGVTLSYFFIVLAVAVLVVWLLLGANKSHHGPTATNTVPRPSVTSTCVN